MGAKNSTASSISIVSTSPIFLPRHVTASVSGLKRWPWHTSHRHLHIRQEAHADGAHALPLAGGAAAIAGVEREARWRIATRARFERIGEQLADGVPHADVGRRARTRRLADRRLIDFEHAVDRFPAGDRRRNPARHASTSSGFARRGAPARWSAGSPPASARPLRARAAWPATTSPSGPPRRAGWSSARRAQASTCRSR